MKRNNSRDLLVTFLFIVAVALITYGAFLIFRPVAFVVLGLAVLYVAASVCRVGDK